MTARKIIVRGSLGMWAAEMLALVPGASADPYELRASYVGWCSDRGFGWHPMSKQRALVKAIGGRYTGTKDKTRVLDVLPLPLADSGYRALSRGHGPVAAAVDPTEALVLLWEEGFVSDRRALDMAMIHLGGLTDTRTCRVCGMVTRRSEGRHASC